MFKKALQVELKNTPTDTPLVCSSVSSVLNRDESLSVQSKVLACNSPEVDLLQSQTGGQNSRVSVSVFVQNIRKFPPMFARRRKAILWKKGEGVNSSPF